MFSADDFLSDLQDRTKKLFAKVSVRDVPRLMWQVTGVTVSSTWLYKVSNNEGGDIGIRKAFALRDFLDAVDQGTVRIDSWS